MTVLEQLGDAQTKIATVVLRAATASLIDDLERAVDDGVNAVRMLCKDPRLLAGGGACEMELSKRLRDFCEASTGMDHYALAKFADAFEVVPRALAETSGLDQTKVIAELRDQHAALVLHLLLARIAPRLAAAARAAQRRARRRVRRARAAVRFALLALAGAALGHRERVRCPRRRPRRHDKSPGKSRDRFPAPTDQPTFNSYEDSG